MPKHDNSWLRALGAGEGWDAPVLTIRCYALPGIGRPVAAVTRASVEDVYLLHRHDGLGSPLDEWHGPVFVTCRCSYGHRLDQRKVLARVKTGDPYASVSDVSYEDLDLDPLD